jgi:hypothetical protein
MRRYLHGQTVQTAEIREKFLGLLREIGNVTHAAAGAGIGCASVYEWRYDDPAFARDWDAAVRLGGEGLEDIARERARNGSDLLMIFLLKGIFPEKYRDRVTIDLNQQVTVQDLRKLPREELLRRLDELRREQDTERLMIEGSAVHD